ncbi:MAG: hypothetical protein ACRD19_01470 [Terriglobia bacterium]
MGNLWDNGGEQIGWPLYPGQDYDLIGSHRHTRKGERTLMFAVLRDGVLCYLDGMIVSGNAR